MTVDLAKIGACPRCRGDLVAPTGGPPGGGSGARPKAQSFDCASCGAVWPVVKGIPRFVDSEHYVGSFGWEWRRHKRTQIDDDSSRQSEETFAEKTGLSPADVKGKLVLDVGVGSGRFSHVVARWGGIPVGVDLSLAVLSAHRNLRAFYPNALVCQGDAFRLPFKPETFDVVFSIGVLHHTPSTRGAFRSVAPLVKPGGVLAIGLYDADASRFYEYTRRYRRYTTELSHPLLHALSHVAIPAHHVLTTLRSFRRGRHLAGLFHKVVMTSEHKDPLWQVLDTFDWYSPRYQWLHHEAEAKRWFEELGFERVRRLPETSMVSVRGERPLVGPLRTPSDSPEERWGELDPLPGWLPGSPAALRTALLLALLAGEVGRAARRELGGLVRELLEPLRPAVTSAVVATKALVGVKGDLLAPKGRPRP